MRRAVILAGIWACGWVCAAAPPAEERTPLQRLWEQSFAAERATNYVAGLEATRQIIATSDCYLANLRLGWLQYLRGAPGEGIAAYNRAVAMAPGAVTPLLGLVNCYMATGQTNEAWRTVRTVLAIDPMQYTANLRIAELSTASGDHAAASAYYRKLAALYPEDMVVADALAWSCLRQGLKDEAQTIFTNVLIAFPADASAREGYRACTEGPHDRRDQTKKPAAQR